MSFGGLFGNTVWKGEEIIPIIHSKEQLFVVIDAAVDFFKKHANPGERFRFTIERVGKDEFVKTIKEAYYGFGK